MIFWGTFFPLISEAVTGETSSLGGALVQPLHDAARDRARALHRDRPAARLAAGQRRRRWRLVRGAARRRDRGDRRGRWRCHRRLRRSPLALALFASPPSPSPPLASGVLARRPPPGGRSPAAAVSRPRRAVVTRNRRRYGGYIVHAGFALLLIGVAASSSFQTSRDLRLTPGGERATVGDYAVTYVRPTAVDRPRRAEAHLRRGARRSTADGEHVATLDPARDYYSSTSGDADAPLGLLRGRGDQRGRPQDERRRGPLDGDAARPDAARPVIAEVDAAHGQPAPSRPGGPDDQRSSRRCRLRRLARARRSATSRRATSTGRRRRDSASTSTRS